MYECERGAYSEVQDVLGGWYINAGIGYMYIVVYYKLESFAGNE